MVVIYFDDIITLIIIPHSIAMVFLMLTVIISLIAGSILVWDFTTFAPVSMPISEMPGYNSALDKHLNTSQLSQMIVFKPS